MSRRKTTGRFDTRQELEDAIWARSRLQQSDSEIARAVGITSTTVARILRQAPPPKHKNGDVDLVYPMHAEHREVVNAKGVPIASAKTDTIAGVIVSAMNEST